jgi:heme exporter protein D
MKRNPRKLARFIPVLLPISLLSQILLTEFSTFKHNFFYPIPIYEKITLDAYGAVLPALLSVSFIILYFSFFKGSFLRFFGCFLFAFVLSAISFIPTVTDNGFGLQSIPVYLAFFISLVSLFIIFFDEYASKTKTLSNSIRSQIGRNYILTLLVAFSVSSLSALSIDLIWAPFLNQSPAWTTVNIGGGGITDGVLFSGLFALVWTTFFVSLLALIIEILRTSQRKDNDKKKAVIEPDRKRSARKAKSRTRKKHFSD